MAAPNFCTSCGKPTTPDMHFCTECGAPSAAPVPVASPPPVGRPHSPALALAAGILIPGAGQAYNGHAWKAFFFMLTSVLVLPWIGGVAEAFVAARRIQASGGRPGRGGILWIALQAWLLVVVALFALIVLTVAGVMR